MKKMINSNPPKPDLDRLQVNVTTVDAITDVWAPITIDGTLYFEWFDIESVVKQVGEQRAHELFEAAVARYKLTAVRLENVGQKLNRGLLVDQSSFLFTTYERRIDRILMGLAWRDRVHRFGKPAVRVAYQEREEDRRYWYPDDASVVKMLRLRMRARRTPHVVLSSDPEKVIATGNESVFRLRRAFVERLRFEKASVKCKQAASEQDDC